MSCGSVLTKPQAAHRQSRRTKAAPGPLILFSSMEDKPRDLIITGAIRARMCEKLAESLKIAHPERCFLVGLFSVLDAVFDRPLEEVVNALPLVPNIVDALLRHEGQLGSLLRCVLAYEQRDWPATENCVQLKLETISAIYEEAVAWSLRSLSAVSD